MNEIEETLKPGYQNSNSGDRGAAAHANATLHDRTGLLIAVVALAVSVAGLVIGVMGYMSNRDQNSNLKDEVIRLEGEIQLLKIERKE